MNYMFKQTTSIVCIFFLSFNAWGFININQAYPDPGLKPNKVVAIQLLAMQQNGASDYGIEVTFRFASPQNKLQTGPLSNFIMLGEKWEEAPQG